MSTVFGIAVVSSDAQQETLAYQRKWIEETAQKNSWTLARVFEGVSSGKNGVRAKVAELVDAIRALPKAQRPERVLMIRTDRLGRESLEVIALLAELRKLGVVVHTRADGDLSLAKASESLLPIIQSVVASLENEARKDKTNAVYRRKQKLRQEHRQQAQAKEGRAVAVSPRAPYGLKVENGYLVPREPEASAVRVAFEMKASGYGAHVIAKHLASTAPPLIRKSGEAVPQHWDGGRVLKLLKVDAYRGAIVDETTWLRAQQPARQVSQPTRTHEWPLSGALRCECGKALIGLVSSGPKSMAQGTEKRVLRKYYLCRNLAAHKGKSKTHRDLKVEKQFVDLLNHLVASPQLIAAYAAGGHEASNRKLVLARLSELRTEISKFEGRKRRLLRGFEDGLIPDRDFRDRLAEVVSEHASCQAEADALERQVAIENAARVSSNAAREIIGSAARLWATADTDERKAMARAVARVLRGLVIRVDGSLVPGVALEQEQSFPSASEIPESVKA